MLVHGHENISARVCHVSILRLVKGGLVLSPFTARCRPKPNVKKLTDATTKEEEKRHYITYTCIFILPKEEITMTTTKIVFHTLMCPSISLYQAQCDPSTL